MRVSGVTKYLCICSNADNHPAQPVSSVDGTWLQEERTIIWTYDVNWRYPWCADCTCGRRSPVVWASRGFLPQKWLTLRSTGFLSLTSILLCCFMGLLVLAYEQKEMVCKDHDAHPSSRCQTLQRDSVSEEDNRKKLDGNLFMVVRLII